MRPDVVAFQICLLALLHLVLCCSVLICWLDFPCLIGFLGLVSSADLQGRLASPARVGKLGMLDVLGLLGSLDLPWLGERAPAVDDHIGCWHIHVLAQTHGSSECS